MVVCEPWNNGYFISMTSHFLCCYSSSVSYFCLSVTTDSDNNLIEGRFPLVHGFVDLSPSLWERWSQRAYDSGSMQ